MPAWSYSAIKTFEQCPKKYYHTRVARDVTDVGGEAAIYGTDVHAAAELYVRDGTPIPKKFDYMAPIVNKLMSFPGTKLAEQKLGIAKLRTGEIVPCDFDDPEAWWRGIADLLIIENVYAKCIDYKTSKNAHYADLRQLDLLSGAVFLHHPTIKVIDGALLFVVCGQLVPKRYHVDKLGIYLSTFDKQLENLADAHRSGVWNAKASGLCGWCPVTECENWFERRK
jgi:hypothetical protein